MDPTRLSQELRTDDTPDMTRRRWIIALSLVNATIGAVVGSYQTGILTHLPDPPVGPFDSDRVDASDYGYKRLDTPDGFLMMASLGATAVIASRSGKDRAEDKPWIPLALAAKSIYDVGVALKLTQEEWADNKALCFYCQCSTVISAAVAVLAMPEAARAMKRLA